MSYINLITSHGVSIMGQLINFISFFIEISLKGESKFANDLRKIICLTTICLLLINAMHMVLIDANVVKFFIKALIANLILILHLNMNK